MGERDAQQRLEETKKVVDAFFPNGVSTELLVSDVTDYSQPIRCGCAQQLFNYANRNTGKELIDQLFLDLFGDHS